MTPERALLKNNATTWWGMIHRLWLVSFGIFILLWLVWNAIEGAQIKCQCQDFIFQEHIWLKLQQEARGSSELHRSYAPKRSLSSDGPYSFRYATNDCGTQFTSSNALHRLFTFEVPGKSLSAQVKSSSRKARGYDIILPRIWKSSCKKYSHGQPWMCCCLCVCAKDALLWLLLIID